MGKPLMLIILDGFGSGDENKGNAVSIAHKPNIEKIFSENPTVLLSASGLDVGLPDGQMGNSEVGHTNIGAGRIVYQDLTRITKSIRDGSFFKNKILVDAMNHVANSGSALHLMGLLSDGGVHSHNSHLFALLEMASKYGVKKVCVHAWLDGRDVPPKSGIEYLKYCEGKLSELKIGHIETIAGRYYSMDRDNRWDRTNKAYLAMIKGLGPIFTDITGAIEQSYKDNITDEFIVPAVRKGYTGISPDDTVICFNFRPDRVRQITRAFVEKSLDKVGKERIYPYSYICLTEYDSSIQDVKVAYNQTSIKNTFGEYISNMGLRQLRIAETEKYAHVTFFFNGGMEPPLKNEDRILVPSPHVATYDLKPEMSAETVTEKTIESIKKNIYDVIIINLANCDMVGHTGVFVAAVNAVETVDKCIGRIIEALKDAGGSAIITADHGNAEKMIDEDGSPFTAHTTNPVPFCIFGYKCKLRSSGRLSDIAPTMLKMLGLSQPIEMEGESLIK